MKRSEVLEKYRDKIMAAMVSNYRTVITYHGSVQEDIYVWDDGEIIEHEEVQGSNGQLVPSEAETRELFFVCCIEMPYYDPWDGTIDGPPDDEDEREREEKELIDYEVTEYESNVSDYLDEIIAEAKWDEQYFGVH